jgi:CBS domain-containing protein
VVAAQSPPGPFQPVEARPPLITLHLYDTVARARLVAEAHGVHHLAVVDNERVVGIVCVCDLNEADVEHTVGTVMQPAVTIPANRSTEEAARLMKAADVSSVLVTDGRGSPCAVLTRSDLSGARRPVSDVRALLADSGIVSLERGCDRGLSLRRELGRLA